MSFLKLLSAWSLGNICELLGFSSGNLEMELCSVVAESDFSCFGGESFPHLCELCVSLIPVTNFHADDILVCVRP